MASFAVAIAAWAAAGTLAHWQIDPAGAAETAFLARLAGGVLLALAMLAPPPAHELGATAVLSVTGIWIVGHGPHRGALIVILLLSGLAVAVARGAWRPPGPLERPGTSVALALALQWLMRGDLLLPPFVDADSLLGLLGLPLVCGLALYVLAARLGERPAWIAGATALVLGPGFDATTTLTLGVLAAGVALGGQRYAMARAAVIFALAVSILALLVIVFARPWEGSLALLVLGLGLLPGAVTAVFLAALVALVAVLRPDRANAGSSVPGGSLLGTLRRYALGPVGDLQVVWSSFLALSAVLLAAYPWRRERPIEDLFQILGLGEPLWAALVAVLLVSGLGLALRPSWAPRPGIVLMAALLLLLATTAPRTAHLPIAFEPVRLDSAAPRFFYPFKGQRITAVVVDTHLVQGHELAPGTPVAVLLLRDAAGHELGRWPIRAGHDTAEWAAARPDVAALPGFVAPAAWLSRLAASGNFFIERFRFRQAVDVEAEAASVALRRHPGLPSEVALIVHRLELRR